MAGLNNNPTIARGSPEPQNFGRRGGFEHPDRRVDDDLTQAATLRGGYSDQAARDMGAIEINFDRMANGMIDPADLNGDYLIPGWVAQNGMDPARRNEVTELLRQVGSDAGLDPAVIQQVEGMYADGIDTQNFARDQGLSPYGQRPGELGQWTD